MNCIIYKRIDMRILTCDPSLTAFGWVVMEGSRIVDCGVIKTTPSNRKLRIRKGDDRCSRISLIVHSLMEIIKKYEVDYIVSEQPHGSQSASAAIMVGIVLGILQTLADCKGLGIEWYSEGDCKMMLLGKRAAEKNEILNKISSIFNYRVKGVKYVDEALADALAVYYTALQTSPVLKYKSK